MARKTVLSEHIKEIRKALEDNKAIIGTDETLKSLRAGKIAKVFVASTCTPEMLADLEKYCALANVPLIQLKYANDELGTLCKKQHYISVLSIGA